MNKIYGFGNALIDVEIQISESQLKSIDIPKGTMKHISNNQLRLFTEEFSNQTYSSLPGGSIANSLYAANQHNADTYFSCSIGDDEYGNLFINSFKDSGNSISFYKSDLPTGVCLIFVTPDGQRTMAANLGANLDLHPDSLNIDKLKSSEFLLFDNFSLSSLNALRTVQYSLTIKPDIRICFGVSDVSLVQENHAYIKELFQNKIEILFGNEAEITAFEQSNLPSSTNTLVTYGKNGANFNSINIKASKVNMVNSNGAGDALIGTFLAYLDTTDQKKALQEAVSYASKVCETNGPRL